MKYLIVLFIMLGSVLASFAQKKVEIIPSVIHAEVGSQISVPVLLSGFNTDTSTVVAIEFYIAFNNSALTFDSIVNVNSLMPKQEWFFSNPGATLNRFSCNWAEPTFVNNVSVPDEAKLFDIVFTYNGGESSLEFDETTSLFVHLDPGFNFITLQVDYFDGMVIPAPNQNTTNWNGNGDWNTLTNWSAGIPTIESVAVIQSGSVTVQNAVATSRKMEIMDGATVKIMPLNSLSVADTLTNNGLLQVVSNETGSGSVIVDKVVSGAGNYAIEQFMLAGSHLTGAPLANETTNVFNTAPVSSWDETSASFGPLAAGSLMENAKGYKVDLTGNTTAVFEGNNLHQGNIIVSLSNANTGNIETAGLNLVCNPYPSAIEWLLGDWDFQNVGKAIYVWDKTRYRVWNGFMGDITDGILPAMQGFFVKATGNNPQITIPNNARLHSGLPFYKETRNLENVLTIEFGKLEGGTPGEVDDVIFYQASPEATAAFDPEYDAYKLAGTNGTTVAYSMLEGGNVEKMAIDVRPLSGENIPSVALGFVPASAGTYYLRLKNVDSFNQNTPIVLQDLGLGVAFPADEIDMRADVQDFTYSFSATANDEPARFNLFFSPVGVDELQKTNNFSMQLSGNDLIIRNQVQSPQSVNLEIYDLMGRKLQQDLLSLIDLQKVNISGRRGILIVRLTTNGQVITQKFYK